jgi:hypothetical protein
MQDRLKAIWNRIKEFWAKKGQLGLTSSYPSVILLKVEAYNFLKKADKEGNLLPMMR